MICNLLSLTTFNRDIRQVICFQVQIEYSRNDDAQRVYLIINENESVNLSWYFGLTKLDQLPVVGEDHLSLVSEEVSNGIASVDSAIAKKLSSSNSSLLLKLPFELLIS